MKKKLLSILLLVALVFALSGCGNKNSKGTESDQTKQETEQQETPTPTEDTNNVTTAESTLDDLEQYLLGKNLLMGEKTETFASLIGAETGFKYLDTDAEFYEYDINSEAYKTLKDGGSVPLEGMEGFSVSATAINGKFVLITSSEGNVDQALIDAFNSFK